MQRPPILSILLFLSPAVFALVGVNWPLFEKEGARQDREVKSTEERWRAASLTMQRAFSGAPPAPPTFNVLDPVAAAVFDSDSAQSEPASLPEGEGRDLVAGVCSGCHSLEIVTQQRMTPALWDYTLDWMVETQGMPALSERDRAVVLDYLTANFSSQ